MRPGATFRARVVHLVVYPPALGWQACQQAWLQELPDPIKQVTWVCARASHARQSASVSTPDPIVRVRTAQVSGLPAGIHPGMSEDLFSRDSDGQGHEGMGGMRVSAASHDSFAQRRSMGVGLYGLGQQGEAGDRPLVRPPQHRSTTSGECTSVPGLTLNAAREAPSGGCLAGAALRTRPPRRPGRGRTRRRGAPEGSIVYQLQAAGADAREITRVTAWLSARRPLG